MLRCREISKLVSESMDRDLPLRQRIEVWMHLAMCRLCAGFARQLKLLRRAARKDAAPLSSGDAGLSDEAKTRIKQLMQDG